MKLSQILALLKNPFYYGEFQYPESLEGKWFKGAHKPLISRELFDQVQQSRGVYKGVWGSKTFAFRGLLKCGYCGADVTAEEKFKKLKSGEFNRHVYYRCTKVDRNCPEKYINETDLRELLLRFIEEHSKTIQLTDKLQAKVEKHYSVTRSLFDHYKVESKLDRPFIEYTRYVLTHGTFNDQLYLAMGIKQKLLLKQGTLHMK